MTCDNCKTENSPDFKFCCQCGTPLVKKGKTCINPECGKTNLPEDALFCPDCGTKIIRAPSYNKALIISEISRFIDNIESLSKVSYERVDLVIFKTSKEIENYFNNGLYDYPEIIEEIWEKEYSVFKRNMQLTQSLDVFLRVEFGKSLNPVIQKEISLIKNEYLSFINEFKSSLNEKHEAISDFNEQVMDYFSEFYTLTENFFNRIICDCLMWYYVVPVSPISIILPVNTILDKTLLMAWIEGLFIKEKEKVEKEVTSIIRVKMLEGMQEFEQKVKTKTAAAKNIINNIELNGNIN